MGNWNQEQNKNLHLQVGSDGRHVSKGRMYMFLPVIQHYFSFTPCTLFSSILPLTPVLLKNTFLVPCTSLHLLLHMLSPCTFENTFSAPCTYTLLTFYSH